MGAFAKLWHGGFFLLGFWPVRLGPALELENPRSFKTEARAASRARTPDPRSVDPCQTLQAPPD